MRKGYRNNKTKCNSRNRTNSIINGTNCYKKYNPLKKVCKCGSKKNLKLRFEIYPTRVKEIKKALDDGKIYYLCAKCHVKSRKKK